MSVLQNEVVSSAGPLQICTVQEAGSETPINTIKKFFEQRSTDGALRIDAVNVLNSIN